MLYTLFFCCYECDAYSALYAVQLCCMTHTKAVLAPHGLRQNQRYQPTRQGKCAQLILCSKERKRGEGIRRVWWVIEWSKGRGPRL